MAGGKLELQPITYAEACAYVAEHHRHHQPPQGHKFSIALNDGDKIVGVIMVGRPVARHLDNGYTLEVTRCCTDGTRHAPSMLYGAAWRAGKALGYKRMITYIFEEEPGTTLKAAGWKELYTSPGGAWVHSGRPRANTHPLGQKTLWEAQ